MSVMSHYPDSAPDMSSPDATSPYPDRPIRPLPKKPLRDRIPPDLAQTIKYPPAPKTTTPLFYYGYNPREDAGASAVVESQHPTERKRVDEAERNYISRRNGDTVDSDEDEQAYGSRIYSRPSADTAGRSYRYVQKPDPKHQNPPLPVSTASSVDGYDSFENTNNKKKRKIPTPGDSSLAGVHLSSDLAGMGISGPDDLGEEVSGGVGSYHGSGSGHGISGPGRGRYGRIRNGRSPLGTLSDATSNWGNGRSTKQRQSLWASTSESPGIISESIASANAEKFPITPSRGQENVSILQQQASKKTSPTSTQFTFTCDSQVPGTVPWPGPASSINSHMNPIRNTPNGTQTSPNMASNVNPPPVASQAKQGLGSSQTSPNPQKQASTQTAPPKKPRRKPGNEYLIAARQRREQQKWRNDHHPIPKEDQWTCEFCEYEQIFGTPPVALIKQYEIKDRHARKQEAERRRLLEKAKMKGRKGKKGSKAMSKANPGAQDRHAQRAQQPASMNPSQSQSQDTQSEDYYEDEYDDEYIQDEDQASPSGTRVGPTHDSLPPDINAVNDPGVTNTAIPVS